MRAVYAVVPVAVAAGLTLLVAQEPAQSPPFTSEANYVRVDMHPTLDGAPITDLLQAEVEVLEDGVPQKIERFEHVVVGSAGQQSLRRDPANIDEARQAAANPRARVFVLFLDPKHVSRGVSAAIRPLLVSALNRIIGEDDLIAVMTPAMSARNLRFTRATTSIEDYLGTWWGERDSTNFADPVEDAYAICYPGLSSLAGDEGIAQKMILRHRERQSLEALEDLVQHLRTVREERKAVITISFGWRVFEPDPQLGPDDSNRPPPAPVVGAEPGTGRLVIRDATDARVTASCERDRRDLSALDSRPMFRNILDDANRANVSFYTVDPRGLSPFDDDILPVASVGNNAPLPLVEEQARLRDRGTSLRTMAEDTDGLAIVQTNQIAAGFERMANDLSSYYLVGYYSTQKADGKFHRITVRIKRPGAQVRARRGYLAAAAAPAAARGSRPTVVAPETAAEARALQNSLAQLSAFTRTQPLRVQTAAGYTPSGQAMVWVIAEADRASRGAGGNDWSKGGQVDVALVNRAGEAIATDRLSLPAGVLSARIALKPPAPLMPGEYQLQIRATSADGAVAASDSARILVPEASGASGAMFARRGQTTGNRQVHTADLRFRRTERLFIEIPTSSSESPQARLLDRTGQALEIPVTSGLRDDPDGSRWRTAQVALAALAPGDYLVEITAGTDRTLTAFRVVP
jgi:VWFA-related protein